MKVLLKDLSGVQIEALSEAINDKTKLPIRGSRPDSDSIAIYIGVSNKFLQPVMERELSFWAVEAIKISGWENCIKFYEGLIQKE